jgi:hypothetical protein
MIDYGFGNVASWRETGLAEWENQALQDEYEQR